MKKFWIVLVLLVFVIMAIGYSQTIVYTNQKDVTWDLSTKLENGQPIPSGDVISYEVWLKDKTTNLETILKTVSAPPYTVTLPSEGKYLVGVRAKRVTQSEIIYSTMNWSDNITLNPNTTFELRFFVPVEVPRNLSVTP